VLISEYLPLCDENESIFYTNLISPKNQRDMDRNLYWF